MTQDHVLAHAGTSGEDVALLAHDAFLQDEHLVRWLALLDQRLTWRIRLEHEGQRQVGDEAVCLLRRRAVEEGHLQDPLFVHKHSHLAAQHRAHVH